jgi:hypothetical protein
MFHRSSNPAKPPGPSGFELLKQLCESHQNTFRAFAGLARDYGDAVEMPL